MTARSQDQVVDERVPPRREEWPVADHEEDLQDRALRDPRLDGARAVAQPGGELASGYRLPEQVAEALDPAEHAVEVALLGDENRNAYAVEAIERLFELARGGEQDEVGLERNDPLQVRVLSVADVRLCGRFRRVVAEGRVGDEAVADPEREDDLGETGRERDDALGSLGHPHRSPDAVGDLTGRRGGRGAPARARAAGERKR